MPKKDLGYSKLEEQDEKTGSKRNGGNMTAPLAVSVRQCRVCRGIYSWPILDMTDVLAYSYLHCGEPTDYIEMRATEREPICCDGDSDVGTTG